MGRKWLFLLAGACATVPNQLPSRSALSSHGAEAAPANVAASLITDPPLPGEHAPGWQLDAPDAGELEPPHAH